VGESQKNGSDMMGDMRIGVIIGYNDEFEATHEKMWNLGFDNFQLGINNRYFKDQYVQHIHDTCKLHQTEITALWCGLPGPTWWDAYLGPSTVGLVPAAYRSCREEVLLSCSDFAKKLGVINIVTHAGFIPENPNDPDYQGTIVSLKYIADYFYKNGQFLLLETGQETPVTLLRTMADVGGKNLGVNFDPANLLMYGKANPLDAIDLLMPYVRGVHAKDGEYPVDGYSMGLEKPLGSGSVNFPALLQKMIQSGYSGSITIEREINGERQIADIQNARKILKRILNP
jgi:L-ribulose-5-phosphate 3-epimerase